MSERLLPRSESGEESGLTQWLWNTLRNNTTTESAQNGILLLDYTGWRKTWRVKQRADDQLAEIVDDSCPSFEFKSLATTSNFKVSWSILCSKFSASSISSDISNYFTHNEHWINQNNVHAYVLSRFPVTSAKTGKNIIYLDQALRVTRSLDRRSLDALSSVTDLSNFIDDNHRNYSDTYVIIYCFDRNQVSARIQDYYLKSIFCPNSLQLLWTLLSVK